MTTNNSIISPASHDRWKPYYNLMLWSPIIAGFLLPYVINSLFDSAYITDLIKDTDELGISVVGALVCSIPFFSVACFTRKDKESNIALKKGLTNLAIRFLPVFMLYAFVLFNVARSAALRLPGASTAPIAILLIQPIAVLLVFVVNWILRQVTRKDDKVLNA